MFVGCIKISCVFYKDMLAAFAVPFCLVYAAQEPPVTIIEEGPSLVRSLYAKIIHNIYDNNPSFPRPFCFSNQSYAWWCGNSGQTTLDVDDRDGLSVNDLTPSPSPSPNNFGQKMIQYEVYIAPGVTEAVGNTD